MSIRFGMTLAEVFNQLVKGYQKVRGVEPKGLDLIKIKQEAMQRFQDMRKVLDMQGNPIDPSKPIMGGSQQGEALKSGIMKATGAGPKVVEGINPKFIDYTIDSFKNMDGIKVMREANKIIKREGPYKDLTKKDAKRIMDAVDDKLKNIDMDPEDMYASGGRAGFKDGEGIMQMTSAPDPMDERNMVMESIAREEFGKPLKDLSEDEIIQIEEMMMEMSKVDRGAPSITLADGGRAAFKDGQGMFEKLFYNKAAPILSGFNTSELFDLVTNLSSSIPFADGGRAAFKDGPKDPRRRTFMKAAAGIASMIPLGGAKIIGKAAPVVAKAAEISGPALAKIVDTVMSLGKLISVKGKRVKEMVTKKKHEGVEVTEDIMDGSYTIKKGGKEIYYKPGKRDEMGIEDDIIEVIEKTVTKKAGGGVARLLGE
tara:strand:- start:100 stop:1377 length:1278 start_codon:yes stop_codon:yes gene_type:complete